MNSKKKGIITASIFLLLIFGTILTRFSFREISRSESSCGNYGFISSPCSQLPTLTEAEKVLNQHESKVDEIKSINPGLIDVHVQEHENCTGKGIILITHPSEGDCDSLRKILEDNPFEVPYRIVNN